MKTTTKRVLVIVSFVLILGIVGMVLFINSLNLTFDQTEENKLKFDKALWVHYQTKTDENIRHYMLTDLQSKYLKRGMDSTKVIKLLGQPERQFGFSYDLGFYESGFDHTFLILEFNEKGKLVKTSVQTI